MIFVTVGSQMPFDRLIIKMDEWSKKHDEINVFAQIGQTSYKPQNMQFTKSLSPEEFNEVFSNAHIIVAHAGMGTVLTALELGKPIVLMPRLGEMQETRNDHQIATSKWLANRSGIFIAENEEKLPFKLEEALCSVLDTPKIGKYAPDNFITALKKFISAPY